MKKAKVVLAALGVFAIVGGALAFKANASYGGNLQCTTTTVATNICPLVTYTTVPAGGTILRCKPIGAPAQQACVPQRVVFDL